MRTSQRQNLFKWLIIIVVLLGVGVVIWHVIHTTNAAPATIGKKSSSMPAASSNSHQPTGFNKNLYPLDSASSLWVIVNKGRILPGSYVPSDLTIPNMPLRLSSSSEEMHVSAKMAPALESLAAAAQAAGAPLRLASGYRSYQFQVGLYNGYVKSQGQASADASSARPGHSEHQTGLAADLEPLDRSCEVEQCFDSTPAGKWLAANAYKYGFIIRYQAGKEKLTGYEYEPWHVRYVGTVLAAQIQTSGQTLEQFFNLPIYPDYPAQSVQLTP